MNQPDRLGFDQIWGFEWFDKYEVERARRTEK
jgi:hypothetical protein